MLRGLTTLNPVSSINQRTRLLEMNNIVGGAKSARHKMYSKFYGRYMNHPNNKHDKCSEEKYRKREASKKCRYQRTRDS